MSEEPERTEEEPEKQSTQKEGGISNLATALAVILVGVIALWYPTYLGIPGDTVWGIVGFFVFYIFATFSLIIGVIGTVASIREDPSLRQFIREIMPIRLPGSDELQNAAITATLVFIIGMIHFVAFTLLGATGLVEIVIKAILLLLFVFTALFTAVTIDGFIFKPLRERLLSGRGYTDEEVQRARRVVIALGGSTGTIVAVIELFIR